MKRLSQRRQGNVLVLTAFLIVVLLAMVAFAVDIGFVLLTRTQLQRAADAAALAAAWEMIDDESLSGNGETNVLSSEIRTKAEEYAASNRVLRQQSQLALQDVSMGYVADPFSSNWHMQESGGAGPYNAVTVHVRRHADQNGELPLFFARVFGHDSVAAEASATAVVLSSIRGFAAPSDGSNLGILPFALDEETWLDMLAGGGDDAWTWSAADEAVVAGSDGIREINLYPQGTGSPGNRGTIDIGSNNNSTADIARQILEGASPADLEQHGGKLELDEQGELLLNGDTGISAGVKDELETIKGQPRIIPIFRTVEGPGNNAMYTIIGFAGVRIVDVKLTGKMSMKRVTIQPANVVARGAIPGDGLGQPSHFIYSPVWLLR